MNQRSPHKHAKPNPHDDQLAQKESRVISSKNLRVSFKHFFAETFSSVCTFNTNSFTFYWKHSLDSRRGLPWPSLNYFVRIQSYTYVKCWGKHFSNCLYSNTAKCLIRFICMRLMSLRLQFKSSLANPDKKCSTSNKKREKVWYFSQQCASSLPKVFSV